jgi:23S rRNA (guanine745-N1)-methyltransferase
VSSSPKGHGDDGKMLLDRRAFLEHGHYDPLVEAIQNAVEPLLAKGSVVMDAGCGEGYYTQKIANFLAQKEKKAEIFAFDISKDAVRLTAGRMEKKGCFFVASAFHIPVQSDSVDLILSLFSPYAEEEFLRVLKPGGYLLRAVPMRDHLFSLKKAVYENPTRNEGEATVGERFEAISERRIRADLTLHSGEEIRALFGMTPYAHKTGKEDIEKLNRLEEITTELDFGLLLTRKIK